jgi:hypothetical protein
MWIFCLANGKMFCARDINLRLWGIQCHLGYSTMRTPKEWKKTEERRGLNSEHTHTTMSKNEEKPLKDSVVGRKMTPPNLLFSDSENLCICCSTTDLSFKSLILSQWINCGDLLKMKVRGRRVSVQVICVRKI